MNIEKLRTICMALPAVTEGMKWGNDLCFMIGEKMFCVTGLDGSFTVAFKVTDEEFVQLTSRPGIVPAPYVARYKWVLVEEPGVLNAAEWERYVVQSYELVRAKLPKKVLDTLIAKKD